jgi:Gpi18-like mannosyltransferase
MNLLMIAYSVLLALLFISVLVYSFKRLDLLPPFVLVKPETKLAPPQENPGKWWRTFFYIALLTIFSRLIICLIAYVAIIMERGPQNGGFFQYFYNTFIGPGDTPHYLKIAKHWYASSGADAKYIVFYPLYPLCMMIVNFLISKFAAGSLIISKFMGLNPLHPIYATLQNLATESYFISGLIISNLCLIIACYYLYRLVCLDYEEAKARRAVIFLLLYPFSVFLIGIFTESLFIMLSVMIFYYMRRQKWIIAGLLGFLASMTRVQGILLVFPVLYEYALANQWFKGFGFNAAKILGVFKKLRPSFLFIVIMPLGFGVYLLINRITQGDWFAFYKHITAEPWWQGQDWIGNNLYQHYDMSQQYYSLGLIIYKVQIVEFFVFCGLMVYGLWKKVRTSYLLYMLIYLMVTYTSSWMISGPRYMMGDIPLYIVLAAASGKRNVQAALLILLGLLCVFYTIMFFQGQAIM